MSRPVHRALAAVALVAGAVACNSDATTAASSASSNLSAAFTTTPVAYSAAQNSFSGVEDSWIGGGHDGPGFGPDSGAHHDSAGVPGGDHGHHGGRGDDLGLMGGGLGLEFLGGFGPMGGPGGPGRGPGHGPFGGDSTAAASCTFSTTSGRVTCADQSRNGITVSRSMAFATAAGTAQAKPDSTTNSENVKLAVNGTTVRRDGDTTTLHHASDRTVTGLAKASTQRTVNGTSTGTEHTVGTSTTKGAFVADRVVGDTVRGVVVPVADGRPAYPTAGTVIRQMTATVTYAGQAAQTSTRREVVTYDGSATATVVITTDGAAKTCSLPLPHGRPTCP